MIFPLIFSFVKVSSLWRVRSFPGKNVSILFSNFKRERSLVKAMVIYLGSIRLCPWQLEITIRFFSFSKDISGLISESMNLRKFFLDGLIGYSCCLEMFLVLLNVSVKVKTSNPSLNITGHGSMPVSSFITH